MNKTTIQTRKFIEKIQHGQLDAALRLANRFSQQEPEHPVGYMMLGDALMKKGDYEKATQCYYYSLEKNPDQPSVYIALGEACLMVGEVGKAYENYFHALSMAPNDPNILKKTGNFLILVGRFNDAQSILKQALSLGAPDAAQSLLDLKIHLGNRQEIKSFIQHNRSHFRKTPCDLTLVRAELSLGNYQKVIDVLEAEDTSTFSQTKMAVYYHLLAAAYEKRGDYSVAFRYYSLQNSVKDIAYSPRDMERTVEEIIANSRDMDTSSVHYRDITEQEFSPLYIIGLPRSGTSLLEQILNTSEHVVAGGELLFVEAAYKKYFEKGLSLEEISEWYRQKVEFITKNQEIPKKAPRWLTDKLPSNFINVGFIKNMIPDARFLYCKRNPMDNGLSIYKQDFLNTHSYATRMEDIAHFTSIERKVMASWVDLYGEDIQVVEYEKLIANFDEETKKIFAFADLPWSEDVRNFYKSHRYCNTASFDQVRKPLNNNSVRAYKRFEKEMQPMAQALKALGVEG